LVNSSNLPWTLVLLDLSVNLFRLLVNDELPPEFKDPWEFRELNELEDAIVLLSMNLSFKKSNESFESKFSNCVLDIEEGDNRLMD
jgi:hypothetical protein